MCSFPDKLPGAIGAIGSMESMVDEISQCN